MNTNSPDKFMAGRPNILVLCMDQWDAHMHLPDTVELPAMRRLEAQGVSFDRHYCTVPVCTPSRATMWSGLHAKLTGLWDNTNFAWINEFSTAIPTIGHLLREQGYHTAFKGKWHLSGVPRGEDALDGTVAFEVVDWLEHRAPQLGQPWLLVCSLVNPHDIMFLQTDPIETPHPNGVMAGLQTQVQQLGWFQQQWDLSLPDNHEDDFALQPYGVRHYKEFIDLNYGRVPDDRRDLWLARRNYLVNCMRLDDAQFVKVVEALDRLDRWRDTVVVLTGDHGELNGAHRMTQKGAIAFDEAAVVNLTVCAPGGPRGRRTATVGSHLDLAPTLLSFAGLSQEEIRARYPHLKGRSLKDVVMNPGQPGPRGSADSPGDGALFCWDGLHMLDNDWAISGALRALTELGTSGPHGSDVGREARLREAGRKFGAPDFRRRTFFRAVVDGRYKLVRWFSPDAYGNPLTLDDLYADAEVALYDLADDPGELENLGHPDHPRHDPSLVQRMLDKLHVLVQQEIGDDRPPFDLDLFGTREIKYSTSVAAAAGA